MTLPNHSGWVAGALAVGLALGLLVSTEAQQRALQGTTLRLTDTSVNSALVGCAVGSTNCSGGIKAGTITLARTSLSTIKDAVLGSSVGIEWHLRPASGKKGYLTFTEDSVADRWAIGTENGDAKLYFRSGLYTDSADANLDATGNLTTAGSVIPTGVQNVTTGDGDNDITLTSGVTMLRITTGGTATDDEIEGISGGTQGRELVVCWIGGTGTSPDVSLNHEDAGAVDATHRLLNAGNASILLSDNGCVTYKYDGTANRWRLVGS